MNYTPYYFSDISKEYEIEYLKFNNYIYKKDLSYTKNDCKSIILLFNFEGKNILRGYRDGIMFPQINYFNIENIHIKKKETKLQEIFEYIIKIYDEYNIVDSKIYQDPYLCFKLGYSIFNLIDTKNFNIESNMHLCINYSENVNIENIECEMEGGGTRTIINGFKKNPPTIKIYFGEIENEIFQSFVNKHYELAGKKTKSENCWDLNKEMILNKEAILVVYENNYVLFHSSENYSYYGINACTKGDKIVTYLLYEGIKWLTKNGYKFIHFDIFHKYSIGEKNINISKFKKSFCNKIYTQYYVYK